MLIKCLAAAKNLKHLTLCFERPPTEVKLEYPSMLAMALGQQCVWPCLVSLELAYIPVSTCIRASLLGTCAPSVRQLIRRDCRVWGTSMFDIRDTSLSLTSILITDSAHHGTTCSQNRFSEDSLLDFVN
jgi:hypothetical protein